MTGFLSRHIGNVVGRINEDTLRTEMGDRSWAYRLGMQSASQANSAPYPQRDGKSAPILSETVNEYRPRGSGSALRPER